MRRAKPRAKRHRGIAWAIAAWSRVTQKQVSRAKVVGYARKHGWLQLEQELKYWLEQSKAPGLRKHAPHPGLPSNT